MAKALQTEATLAGHAASQSASGPKDQGSPRVSPPRARARASSRPSHTVMPVPRRSAAPTVGGHSSARGASPLDWLDHFNAHSTTPMDSGVACSASGVVSLPLTQRDGRGQHFLPARVAPSEVTDSRPPPLEEKQQRSALPELVSQDKQPQVSLPELMNQEVMSKREVTLAASNASPSEKGTDQVCCQECKQMRSRLKGCIDPEDGEWYCDLCWLELEHRNTQENKPPAVWRMCSHCSHWSHEGLVDPTDTLWYCRHCWTEEVGRALLDKVGSKEPNGQGPEGTSPRLSSAVLGPVGPGSIRPDNQDEVSPTGADQDSTAQGPWQVCGDCGCWSRGGRVDPSDSSWYCNGCWESFLG